METGRVQNPNASLVLHFVDFVCGSRTLVCSFLFQEFFILAFLNFRKTCRIAELINLEKTKQLIVWDEASIYYYRPYIFVVKP